MIELIKELNNTQEAMDRTLHEIGQKFTFYTLTKEDSLISQINEKVELFQKLELYLNELEFKIRNSEK